MRLAAHYRRPAVLAMEPAIWDTWRRSTALRILGHRPSSTGTGQIPDYAIGLPGLRDGWASPPDVDVLEHLP